MSLGPHSIAPARVREMREVARRQARSVSAGLGIAFALVLALVMVGLFIVLDYNFDQAPHRMIKILLGVAGFATILLRPRLGLLLIPIVTPFLPWIPTIPLPGVNALNILLGSVFVTWAIFRVLKRQSVFRAGRLGWVIGIMLLIALLSLVRGAALPTGYYYDARDAGLQLFRSAVNLSVYFIALAMARGKADRKALAWAIVLGLMAEAACTILYGRNGRGGRAVGSIGQANELGTFLALYAVMAAAMFGATKNWFGKLLLAGAVAAGTFGVILSVSRGAVIALVLGLLYVGWKSSRIVFAVIVLALLTSPLWTPDYLKARMSGTQVEVEGTDETELDGAAQIRVDTWRAIMSLVTDHPVDGVGFAGLAYVLPEAGEAIGLEVRDSSHNTYLRFLGEMGIFGLLVFVFLLWKCWALARAGMKAARDRFDHQLAVGLAGATLGLAVSCAFGDRFFNILITGSFFMAAALVDDILIERKTEPA
jgi:O-antigen ligase